MIRRKKIDSPYQFLLTNVGGLVAFITQDLIIAFFNDSGPEAIEKSNNRQSLYSFVAPSGTNHCFQPLYSHHHISLILCSSSSAEHQQVKQQASKEAKQ